MGLLDWMRRHRSAEPEIIPLPALCQPANTLWCVAVRIDEQGWTAMMSNGPEQRLEFQDLQRVAIRITDDGPGAEDVFWVLSASGQICLIPHGSRGESELFERLLKLPGFDKQSMIAALTCTDNAEFECWQRITTSS